MIKKISILFLIWFIFLDQAWIYAGEGVSLNSLIDEAKANNPEILAAKKRYEAAKTRIPRAKSLEDPSLSLKFEKAQRNPVNLDTTPGMDRMLSISQMLPWFGKLPLKGKIAVVESQMSAGEYKNKELEVINRVKSAYYDLFMNDKEIELKQESLGFLRNAANVAQSRYAVGEMSQGEVFKINLEIARLYTDIINLKQERSAKETRLNSILNRPTESPFAAFYLKEDFPALNQDITVLYESTLENQPELLIFSYAIEKNRYAKSLAKRSYFPDLMPGVVMRGITTGTLGPWDLMLSFSVPLWFWTKQRYEVREAITNLEEAEAAYQAMKNKILAQTRDLASRVEIARNKISLYKDNQIPILMGSIGSSFAYYRTGKGDIMMLLDNVRMLIETKMGYYKALTEYYMNLADLEMNVGRELSEVKNEK